MDKLRLFLAVAVAALFFSSQGHAQADAKPFQDPLDTPAVRTFGFRGVTSQPLMAVTNAGKRIVAVGLRGLVIFSDDNGGSWHQAYVPVETDLVAVQFVTPMQGWASGHDAVILHTEDGGKTWEKQFDNRMAAIVLPASYQKRIASGDTSLAPFLKEVELNTQGDTSLPFLGIHFTDLLHGIAVGSFGMIVATDDGGRHWCPWLDHIDNKGFLNLNVIRKIGNDLLIAGEQGGVYRYDEKTGAFRAVRAPYQGSFFDIVGTGNFILAVGLRGSVYRSTDGGATWQGIETPIKDSVTAATIVGDGATIILATSSGTLLLSLDQGRTFRIAEVPHLMVFSAVSALNVDRILLVGLQGIEVGRLNAHHAVMSPEVSQ